jgi:hypothetical protein
MGLLAAYRSATVSHDHRGFVVHWTEFVRGCQYGGTRVFPTLERAERFAELIREFGHDAMTRVPDEWKD